MAVTTLYLALLVAGAILSLGDGDGSLGVGVVCGSAIEARPLLTCAAVRPTEPLRSIHHPLRPARPLPIDPSLCQGLGSGRVRGASGVPRDRWRDGA